MKLPESGTPREALLARMRELRGKDADWRGGRTFSLVYYAGDEVLDVIGDAYRMFLSENGLSPGAFPSLQRFEAEVLSMAADLFHGATARGNLTSGGTESILMAVKTARDHARATRKLSGPAEMVLPISAHPAFEKAAHYLDVKVVHIPLREDFRVDPELARRAITENTVLVVGSAPAYPHGVIDPIPELARAASERGVLMHVDACLGGYLLPFAEKLGHPVPPFDFRVPGVTSISADLHKYAYAAKGASTVLYRDEALRRFQYFTYSDWPGGLYGSPTMTGTRPGGAIAAAWAVMNHLGQEGYLRLAKGVLATTKKLIEGVAAIPGLRILGSPDLTIFAFSSDTLNVYLLADEMTRLGWHMDRQQRPPSLHLMITPAHAAVADRFLADLAASVERLGKGEVADDGTAALYGMMGTVPDRSRVGDFILQFMENLDRVPS